MAGGGYVSASRSLGPAGCRCLLSDHCGMAHGGVVHSHVRGLELSPAGQRDAREGRRRNDGRNAGEQLPAADATRVRHV